MARNTLRRHWRSRPDEEPLPAVLHREAGWDPWPGVDERVDADVVLRDALAGLRPLEREVLTLVVWEDLSVVDAARALGIPSGSAYRHLHQARLALLAAPGMVDLLTDLNAMQGSK